MMQIKTSKVNPNTMFQRKEENLVPVVIIHNKLHNEVCKFYTEHTGPNNPTMKEHKPNETIETNIPQNL